MFDRVLTALGSLTTWRGIAAALLCLSAVGAPPRSARADEPPDQALATLLDFAHAAVPAGCANPDQDLLVQVLCAGRLRVGVKTNYPGFGLRDNGEWRGYEIDLAHAIAARLGVRVEFVGVTAADRISALGDGRIDLAIATIGHNTQRDSQARFVRPHYYQSETVLVGERGLAVKDWHDVAGRTVCVPVGNLSNAELVSHGARVLIFVSPAAMIESLESGACSLVAHDDSVFAESFARPEFAARFSVKFGFAPVPWGMAVPLVGGERFATALALLLQRMHRDGQLLAMAEANHIATGFLEGQQRIWRRPECDVASGNTNPACVLPPLATDLEPTPFAGTVDKLDAWLSHEIGSEISLPMFTTMPAWSLLKSGMVNTLILVAGALIATFAFAVGFGAMLGSRLAICRWAARMAVIALQSSPTVLTLVIAIALANALAPFSAATALCAAIMAIGLTNGANAGQAISEALATLRREQRDGRRHGDHLFVRALARASKQIEAFLVNATKATPVASFIGTPELLNALTDINSFSSTHISTYVFLLVFYIAAVMIVVRFCAVFGGVLERRVARAWAAP
jgi:ABC-type amino acid transport substrate-binding protein/ABC-type amino acid transport system permease subunit